MLRSRRLQVVLAVEERKEQAALERLTEARERMQQHLEQVQNLQRYQQEYQAQMRQGREGPVSAGPLAVLAGVRQPAGCGHPAAAAPAGSGGAAVRELSSGLAAGLGTAAGYGKVH